MKYTFNSIAKKYIAVSKSSHPKFKFVPRWMDKESSIFMKEIQEKNTGFRSTFKKYARGEIIYLDFGTNIGSEFSFNHFGVVLNKDDSPHKELLTVVPLSSKNKKFYHKINTNLFFHFSKFINIRLNELSNELQNRTEIFINTKNELNTFLKTHTEKTLEDRVFLVELLQNLEIQKDGVDKLNIKLLNLSKTNKKINNLNIHTYACTGNITTISKRRILNFDNSIKKKLPRLDIPEMDVLIEAITKTYI